MCPTLCNPMDGNLPGSSVHGILQARALEWVAMPSPQGIFLIQRSNPCLSVPCTGSPVPYRCYTWEAQAPCVHRFMRVVCALSACLHIVCVICALCLPVCISYVSYVHSVFLSAYRMCHMCTLSACLHSVCVICALCLPVCILYVSYVHFLPVCISCHMCTLSIYLHIVCIIYTLYLHICMHYIYTLSIYILYILYICSICIFVCVIYTLSIYIFVCVIYTPSMYLRIFGHTMEYVGS